MGNILLLFYYLVYLIAVFTAGSWFLNLLRIRFESKIEKKIFEFALGNLVYSLIFIYLGIFHLLYGKLLLVFYLLPSFLFLKRLLFGQLKLNIAFKIKKFLKYRWETLEVFIFLFLFTMFLPIVPHIFAFPTSWDPLAYHLVLPKIYLQDHFFSFYNWFAQTSMPVGIEALFGYGEAFGEPRLSNFIVFTFLVTTVVYIVYGLRYLFSRKVLFVALILFLFKEIVFSSVAVNPFVDFPFAFYGLVCAITLIKYLNSPKISLLVLMLILGLFSFQIKYVLGFVFLFSIVAVLIVHLWLDRDALKKLLLDFKSSRKLIFSLIFVLFLIPLVYWLWRNFVYFHNPIEPFFGNIFKGYGYDEIAYKASLEETRRGSFDFDALRNYLLNLPGDYTGFYRVLRESLLSSILLIFPFLVLFKKEKTLRYVALFGLIFSFIVYWLVGFPSYRYALALAPVLAIIASSVFFDFFRKPFRLYRIPLIAIFIFSFSIQVIYTYRFEIDFFFDNFKAGLKSMLSYQGAVVGLYRQDSYPNINYVNKNLDKSKDKVLVVFDNRLYYFNIPVVYATQAPNGLFTNSKMRNPSEVLDELKKDKINYVFINNNWGIYPNLRKDLYYPFVENYLEPVSSASGTVVYRLKQEL